jgi:hypothetical protein
MLARIVLAIDLDGQVIFVTPEKPAPFTKNVKDAPPENSKAGARAGPDLPGTK